MKRIDLIYETVKKLDLGNGVTTTEISENLNIERSNVSKTLNLLVNEGELFKNSSRPVRYFLKNPDTIDFNRQVSLDKLSYLYPSLTDACKLAKTAILYPPNGMNSLIIGETGSGKSMLAYYMHKYANSFFKRDLPFYHFNCSDYANNVQLLSSHLFGVKKGTFTGATEDRPGLIERANGGILFLDEIHNLPSEGQEMLFLFMDTGFFRRFGEVSKTIKSDVRIICATNEDISTSLLSTFLRRISVKISIPSLKDRPIGERLTLIETFLKEESKILNRDIYVSYNAMLCFLSYNCPFNVGQLKSDIKLAVANAYTDYFINNKKYIKINSPDLSKEMRVNLKNTLLEEKSLLELIPAKNRYYIYNSDTNITNYYFKYKIENLFMAFKTLISNLEFLIASKNSAFEEFNQVLAEYVTILDSYGDNHSFNFTYSTFDEINSKLASYDNRFEKFFKITSLENAFNMHLDLIYDRMSLLSFDDLTLKNRFKNLFPVEYEKALTYVEIIEDSLNLYLPVSEFIVIMLFSICINNIVLDKF